jgi:hypothetical protein
VTEVEDSHAFGSTHYKALHGCIKRYYCESDGDSGADANFGTALHSWLASYHSGTELPVLSEEVPERAFVSEAELARRYAKRFSPSGLGRVELCETRLTMKVAMPNYMVGSVKVLPPTEPFVGTLDLVVDVDDEAAMVLEAERGITINPGLWLVDHKTKTRKAPSLITQYLSDPQFTGYVKLFEHANPGRTVNGTLVNFLYRYKDDKADGFQTLVVPAPDRDAELTWLHTIKVGASRLRDLGEDFVDNTRCFDYSRVCACWDQCPRHNF